MNDKIAIYLRLSLADGDLKKGSKDESNSIENQRMLLHDYIGKQEDLFGEIVEYVDDGYTGTNFNRPAFQKMIVDLKQGNIKVIMVKDLSRLGRDYIGVGDYIEQIFPLMGVRFIAVNNSFDSMKLNNGTPGIEVAVSNLVNNMYSRDIAKKIRAALETNWKNGKATCTNVPFGYVWNKKGGRRWEIDPEAAVYVKKVAVGGLGDPFQVALDAVAADIIGVLTEFIEPVGRGLRAFAFVALLEIGAHDAGPRGQYAHELCVEQVAGGGVVLAHTAGNGIIYQRFEDAFQIGIAHLALRRGKVVQLHGHKQLVADVNFIIGQDEPGVQPVIHELLNGGRDHSTAPPSGRMLSTWQRPSPRMASMWALKSAIISTGTKA